MWDPRPGGRRVLLLRPQNQRRPECVRRSLLSLPTAYLGESQVATGLEAIQDRYAEIDIGSYPFMDDDGYGTTLVIRGTDPAALDKVLDEIKQLIVDAGETPRNVVAE